MMLSDLSIEIERGLADLFGPGACVAMRGTPVSSVGRSAIASNPTGALRHGAASPRTPDARSARRRAPLPRSLRSAPLHCRNAGLPRLGGSSALSVRRLAKRARYVVRPGACGGRAVRRRGSGIQRLSRGNGKPAVHRVDGVLHPPVESATPSRRSLLLGRLDASFRGATDIDVDVACSIARCCPLQRAARGRWTIQTVWHIA